MWIEVSLKWFYILPILIFIVFRQQWSSSKESTDLLIGILSKRDNFLQRNTIRETWYQYAQRISHSTGQTIKIFFIIGQECLVPLKYKQDPYTCDILKINDTEDVKNEIQIQKIGSNFKYRRPAYLYSGFSFQAQFNITITFLGALSSIVEPFVDVSLYNTLNKKLIVHKRVTKFSKYLDGFYYVKLSPQIILPKSFVATLIINSSFDHECNSCYNSWNNHTTLIKILRVYDTLNDYLSLAFKANHISASSFIFTASNKSTLTEYSRDWTNHFHNYLQNTITIKKELEEEASKFKDLLFVETIDTYRNLPEKLIFFISLMYSRYNFKYLLKTDDDCFVELKLVSEFLSKLKGAHQIWWGNFRKHWSIDFYGKWTESEYQSSVYPAFACGSGYVISADIAAWLSVNKAILHRYQGEDVSMGIWLSSIYPNYLQDNRWTCEGDSHISSQFLSRCQLNTSQIFQLFNQR